MKKILFTLFLLFISSLSYAGNTDTIYQTSTIDALLQGMYEGDTTIDEVKKHGDFGLGTFQDIDGEMVELDGVVYKIKMDGKAYIVDGATKTPFVSVTFFESDKNYPLDKELTYDDLQTFIDSKLTSKNIFYAIKIHGTFSYLKLRSVPKQNKPYPKLLEVVKNQAVFEHKNMKGTIVGFKFPAYVKGLNVPNYHFHFISEDKTQGGHVLALKTANVNIQIDESHAFSVDLPKNEAFSKIDLEDESKGTYKPKE